jgi:hypothetical protein
MPVTLTRKQWEGALIVAGLSARVGWSADLNALNEALERYEAAVAKAPHMPATDLRAAFNKWNTGGKPGEHVLARKTEEYAQLERELAAPDPVAVPTRPVPPPAKQMLIAVWNIDHSSGWHSLARGVRQGYLDAVLQHVGNEIATIQATQLTGGAVQAILAAPEYQYTAKWPSDRRFPMAESEKVLLEEELRLKSQTHPHILLIAGTSHYFKDEGRAAGGATHKVNPATGLRTVPKDPAERRLRAQVQLINAKQQATDLGMAFLVDKGDVRYKDDDTTKFRTHNVPALDRLGKVLDRPASKPRFVRNAAYLFLAGRRMAKYDKQTDFSEALNNSPDDMMFIPGTENECPVIGGHRYGVEICYDHCNGVLKKRAPANLQFHIVVSDWTSNRTAHMAMSNGGFFLHASTKSTETAVYRRPALGGEPVKVPPTRQQPYGGSQIDFYVISVPKAAVI